MKLLSSVVIAIVIAVVTSEKVRFDNYRLYKVFIENEGQLESIRSLKEDTSELFELQVWKEPIQLGDDCDVMVSPKRQSEFEAFLKQHGLRYRISIPNIQKLIDRSTPRGRSGLEWTNYHTLDEIYDWLDQIIETNPQVTGFNIGKSFEGRDIRGIKISYKENNPAIFIEANMHAREWISSATITWVVNQLLTSKAPEVREIAENLDWYVIPVFNPDGFVYTHEKNRMWRKTRQPHGKCVGADPNRNFDFLWLTAGSSTDPCSETYAGPRPNSEPEIQNLINYFDKLPVDKIKVYISMHSYGQLVLSPWGHTSEEFPENYDDMLKVAAGYAESVKQRFGTEYRYGASSVVLYKVSGSSKEWAYGVKNIPITYTIELRDQGYYGFVLPPEQIIPCAEEVLDGFVGLTNVARNLQYL